MLRASIPTSDRDDFAPRAITAGVGDAGVEAGAELIAFTDAVVLHDPFEYPRAHQDVQRAVGPTATDRAAMVAGNFSMMNRVLDAVGAPVDRRSAVTAEALGVEIPAHLLAD
jgi:hypothetical protein